MARFVLVHGAFHGAWCWEPLVEELAQAGHEARTFDLPGSGEDATPAEQVTLDAYVEKVCGVLADQPGPSVLVGHSMAGMVVAQAAARCPETIARVVYVAAFLPGDGQSLVDLTKLPEGAGDMVQANMVVEGEPPVARMPAGVVREAFYGHCTPEQAAWAAGRLTPQALAPFVTPVALGDAHDGEPPRGYVVATDDRAIPTALQRRFVAEHDDLDVVELEADHSPFLSRTSALAAALDGLARA
jgi:pimeloyl-ACP methyl ester carboxylesterase